MYLFNVRRKHVAGGTITKKSLAEAVISGVANSYTYTGEPITANELAVRLDGALLSANEDYIVSYSNNTALGLASVTVTGIGNYYGAAVKEFYIVTGSMWTFDVSKIPSVLTWNGFTTSNYVGQVCPTEDEKKLIVSTGGGRYARIGTWNDFNPSTWTQTGATEHTVGSGTGFYTPDGIHYIMSNSGMYVEMRIASSAYDITTIPETADSAYSSQYAYGCSVSKDGRHVLVSSVYGGVSALKSLDLATPWDLSSATNVKSINFTAYGYGPIWVNQSNGRQLVMADWSQYGKRVVKFITLTNPWDVSSVDSVEASPEIESYTQSNEVYLHGIAVNRSGTKMILTLTKDNAGKIALVNLTA